MSITGDVKNEIINRAYRELRISGLTKQPTAPELAYALDTLENMMHEYKEREICIDYNFEDEPDTTSPHNIPRKYWDAISLCLARRLISTFGKGAADKVDPELLTRQRVAFSFLTSSTAVVRHVQAPSRMPIGSGQRRLFRRYRNFYPNTDYAPPGCATNKMVIGEIEDFTEHFDAYLNDGETISAYTITGETGLTVSNDSNTNTDVSYRVTAAGSTSDSTYDSLKVTITVTTSAGRKTIRTINFELTGD